MNRDDYAAWMSENPDTATDEYSLSRSTLPTVRVEEYLVSLLMQEGRKRSVRSRAPRR